MARQLIIQNQSISGAARNGPRLKSPFSLGFSLGRFLEDARLVSNFLRGSSVPAPCLDTRAGYCVTPIGTSFGAAAIVPKCQFQTKWVIDKRVRLIT